MVKTIDMKRDIKFRGKRTDNGKWCTGYFVIADKKHYIFTGETGLSRVSPAHVLMYEDFVRFEVIPETVGQFVCMIPNTSMYVDNSRELYEGDLIRYKGGKTVYRVTFKYNRFYGISNEGDEWGVFTCSLGEKKSLERIEIIGNIHDNPDLLTDE
jgi:hypothetical protein